MSFKAKGSGNYDGPRIDYEAINQTFEDDTYDARISLMIDLGVQERSDAVAHQNKEDTTYVEDEDAANDLIDKVEDMVGEWVVNKENLDEFEEVEIETKKQLEAVQKDIEDAEMGDTVFQLPFRIYSRKDANEVAIFADLVDHYVEYVEGEEEEQYRHMFNKNDFVTKELTGFALTVTKPMGDSDHWTFSPNSMLSKLAKACHRGDILTDADLENDISLILGEPLGIPFTVSEKKGKTYVKGAAPTALRKKDLPKVSDLDVEPVAISFEDATVEQLEVAKPRKAILDKIKKATNYEGSAMQEAVEEYEANLKSSSNKAEKPSEDDEEKTSTQRKGKSKRSQKVSEEAEEAPKKRSREAKEPEEEEQEEETPKKKRGRPAKKKEAEPEVDDSGDEFDSDVPFAPIGLMYDNNFIHCI